MSGQIGMKEEACDERPDPTKGGVDCMMKISAMADSTGLALANVAKAPASFGKNLRRGGALMFLPTMLSVPQSKKTAAIKS